MEVSWNEPWMKRGLSFDPEEVEALKYRETERRKASSKWYVWDGCWIAS